MSFLNPNLQALLRNYECSANPINQYYGGHFDTPVLAYKKYAAFLSACGHDASELAAAIERVEAAVGVLREANANAAGRFQTDPFPTQNDAELAAFWLSKATAGPPEDDGGVSREGGDPRKHSV